MAAGELLISKGLEKITWSQMEIQSQARSRGSPPQVATFGRPRWVIKVQYRNLNDINSGNVKAFIARRRQSAISFTAPYKDRPAILDNPSISNSGLGLSSVDIAASTLALTGLGTNKISVGDMIGYRTSTNGYYIGMALAAVTPTAGAATVSVWPTPRSKHATTPALTLNAPVGEFQLQGPAVFDSDYSRRSSISFDAMEL